jgi:hypothetical protein
MGKMKHYFKASLDQFLEEVIEGNGESISTRGLVSFQTPYGLMYFIFRDRTI